MNGVNILNSYEVAAEHTFSWESFWISFIVMAAVCAFIALMVCLEDFDWRCYGTICAIMCPILGTAIGLLFGFIAMPKVTAYETHYEVSINEEVSMQEFMQKYEILEQRGDIYTVREK